MTRTMDLVLYKLGFFQMDFHIEYKLSCIGGKLQAHTIRLWFACLLQGAWLTSEPPPPPPPPVRGYFPERYAFQVSGKSAAYMHSKAINYWNTRFLVLRARYFLLTLDNIFSILANSISNWVFLLFVVNCVSIK